MPRFQYQTQNSRSTLKGFWVRGCQISGAASMNEAAIVNKNQWQAIVYKTDNTIKSPRSRNQAIVKMEFSHHSCSFYIELIGNDQGRPR